MKLKIRVVPKSSESKVIGAMADGILKIKLQSAPVDDKANQELVKLLAKHFKIPKNTIEILKGKTSKNKIVEIK